MCCLLVDVEQRGTPGGLVCGEPAGGNQQRVVALPPRVVAPAGVAFLGALQCPPGVVLSVSYRCADPKSGRPCGDPGGPQNFAPIGPYVLHHEPGVGGNVFSPPSHTKLFYYDYNSNNNNKLLLNR